MMSWQNDAFDLLKIEGCSVMSKQIETYEDASKIIEQLGILPLSSFIPEHPSLQSITKDEAWHTDAATDPWLWRVRLASEGVAAYGRFIAGKPLWVARDIFPVFTCLLRPSETVEERYQAGLLARSTVHIYELIKDNNGIDVRALRKQAGMQQKSDKNAFDHALIDLQSSADIVISGVSKHLNAQGTQSGWNSTCYMMAEDWMAQAGIEPLSLTRAEAKTQLFKHLAPHWDTNAINYLQKKLEQQIN